jgi:diadenosine tetraphosphate (Ap4A) HIT family hydrolase
MDGCLACELTAGLRELPGGRISETPRWVVEHCVGPLGIGTLIVKPKRHVTHLWELDEDEAQQLGPLLQRVTSALAQLLEPEQVYASLWSHAGDTPVHIHWVLQPVPAARPDGLVGPHLQAAMFDRAELPSGLEVEAIAEDLRALLDRVPREDRP